MVISNPIIQKPTKKPQGIIVGADANQEWLLPWWWMNYNLHNRLPVTFINFGTLSEKAIEWCRRRGDLIDLELNTDFIATKEGIDPETAKMWESMHPEIWRIRLEWFKKPFAMIKSPYEQTLWVDLDCQVKGPVEPLFEHCLNEAGIGLAAEAEYSQKLNLHRKIILPGEIVLNSGVVVFAHDSKVIEEWVKQAQLNNHLHFGDQQLLVRILFTMGLKFSLIPATYNWIVESGMNPNAHILHWSGRFKNCLKQQIEQLHQLYGINLHIQ